MSPYPATLAALTPDRQPWRAWVYGLTAPVIPQLLRLSSPIVPELVRPVKHSGDSPSSRHHRQSRRPDRRLITGCRSLSKATFTQ
jgi:hypothetical protein